MKNQIFFNKQNNKPADPVLKATALIYLKDALRQEEYEKCALLAAQAREYGASEGEIKAAINEVILRLGPNQKGRTFQDKRLRFKERK